MNQTQTMFASINQSINEMNAVTFVSLKTRFYEIKLARYLLWQWGARHMIL